MNLESYRLPVSWNGAPVALCRTFTSPISDVLGIASHP